MLVIKAECVCLIAKLVMVDLFVFLDFTSNRYRGTLMATAHVYYRLLMRTSLVLNEES